MNCQEKGLNNEKKFFAALPKKAESNPEWFGRVRRASKAMDKRGVDAIATIKSHKGSWCVVPIQIKSSEIGKSYFFQHRTLHETARVPVIVIEEHMTVEEIRKRTFFYLKEVRDIAETFKPFMRQLMKMQKTRFGPKRWRRNRKNRERGLDSHAQAAE